MTTVLNRFSQLRTVQAVQKVTNVLFGRYLLSTNVGISIGLSATADILQQHYSILRKPESRTWDGIRTRNMAASGAAVGTICHYWYLQLDHWLPGRTLPIVMKKVVLDQIIFSPLIIGIFFITLGVAEGSAVAKVRREIAEKGVHLYVADWVVWPPAQLVNFYLLPTRFRILYDSAISMGFDVYYSYMKHGVELSRDVVNEEEAEAKARVKDRLTTTPSSSVDEVVNTNTWMHRFKILAVLMDDPDATSFDTSN